MKNAFEKATAKNAEKKAIGCTKMYRVGVMRWASGEVRRGHTSYDSPPKNPESPRSTCLAWRGDLLRRAPDSKRFAHSAGPVSLSVLLA